MGYSRRDWLRGLEVRSLPWTGGPRWTQAEALEVVRGGVVGTSNCPGSQKGDQVGICWKRSKKDRSRGGRGSGCGNKVLLTDIGRIFPFMPDLEIAALYDETQEGFEQSGALLRFEVFDLLCME